ncbi:MAG: DUF6090 family protein [Balneolaceae bacterium]
MLRFFRQLRKDQLMSEMTRKYMLYAIGEILLVVIGILIALQINNWNQQRIEENRIQTYYEQIRLELITELPQIEAFIEEHGMLISMNERNLELLKRSDPDSLELISETIGALGTSWNYSFNPPILNEFLDSEYLKQIENDDLKLKFWKMNNRLTRNKDYDVYISNQYQTSIEPYIIKNFNYQEIALDMYQPNLVEGGIPNDYNSFANNLELWNLLTFKLESLNMYHALLGVMVEEMNDLVLELEEELN